MPRFNPIPVETLFAVGELERIANEENRRVVADQVPIAFFRIEFEREAADVPLMVSRAHLPATVEKRAIIGGEAVLVVGNGGAGGRYQAQVLIVLRGNVVGPFPWFRLFSRMVRSRPVIAPRGSEAPNGAQERSVERSGGSRVAIHAVTMPILHVDLGRRRAASSGLVSKP